MLNYEQFINAVAEKLKEEMGVEYKVVIYESLKTNGFIRKGITVGVRNSNVSPTIYLEEYYKKYVSGWELTEIVESLVRLYEEVKFETCFDTEQVKDFEKAKNKLSYKLINYEMNQQLLKDVPHVQYLDFAIVFYLLLETTEKGVATILITNEMVKYWDTTVDKLYELAEENSPRLLSSEFLPMRIVIKELMGKKVTPSDIEDETMYVLSNKYRHFGAITILYKGVLETIGDYLKKDFYILPSSIHEVIILPVDCEVTEDGLNEMIEEINQTQVNEEEVLSNHAYFYNRASKTLK